MINLIILSLNSLNMFLSLRFMLTSNKLSIIDNFSLINSLTLKIELRCLEISIFKVFKIVNVYTSKKYNR